MTVNAWCGSLYLRVEGPWVASACYKGDGRVLDADGWLPTGDIATIDPDGCLRLVDRAKDCHQIRRRMDQLGRRRETPP
jgi:acyl-CoA synthetase (AMP-forming)/AMP-acid ligase II